MECNNNPFVILFCYNKEEKEFIKELQQHDNFNNLIKNYLPKGSCIVVAFLKSTDLSILLH